MRPNITGKLEEQINEAAEERGFNNGGAFIRFCVRKELDNTGELRDE